MAAFSAHEERDKYLARHRITVDEYPRMGEAGVLPRDARLELLAETWLLDLNARQLEIHLEPSEQGYRRLLKPAPDAVVAPIRIEGIRFHAGGVFPG